MYTYLVVTNLHVFQFIYNQSRGFIYSLRNLFAVCSSNLPFLLINLNKN